MMKMVMQVPEKEISKLREEQQWKGHRREGERERRGKRKRRNRNEKKPISSSLGVQTVS